MENISQMSLIEVAIKLMESKSTPQNIYSLINEVLEMKGLDDETGELKAQLYTDITTSSKFVYMGEDNWDLKLRQSLDEFDKDGAAFNPKQAKTSSKPSDDEGDNDDDELDENSLDEDDDDFDEDDEDRDEEDDEDTDEENEYDEYEYDDEDDDSHDSLDDEDFDEDKYNEYMDEYEDEYDN